MNIEEIKEKILPVLIKHGVKKAGIFGSTARNESRDDSDINMLIV